MARLWLALWLLLGAGPAAAADLRFGTDGNFPPYVQTENGILTGYEPDILAAICPMLGHSCTFVVLPFDQLLPALREGRVDAVMSGMSASPERLAVARFTTNYALSGLDYYVVPAGFAGTLDGLRVAAQAGTLQAAHVTAAGQVLVGFPTLEDAAAALLAGEVQALMAPEGFVLRTLPGLDGALVTLGEGIAVGSGPAIAFRPQDTAQYRQFDQALTAMKADGRLNALYQKWFGREGPF